MERNRNPILMRLFPKKGIRNHWRRSVDDSTGMALLMTLAAISFLIAITVGLATSVNWQVQASRSLQESVRMDAALASCLNLIRASLYADQQKQKYDTLLDGWNNLDEEALGRLLADIRLSIRIRDMSGRIQVNSLVMSEEEKKKRASGPRRKPGGKVAGKGNQSDPEKLQRQLWLRFLLSGKFAVDGAEEALSLVDALSDWLDKDDNERDHGAESGYYKSLQPSYVCRNGPLQYPEELLLVKGFTRKIVYGDKEHEGIIDYLTIYGQDGKININTAPPRVLQALAPGVEEDMVDALVDFRKKKENLERLKNPQWYRHLADFPGDIVFESALVTTVSSYFFVTITAENNGFQQTGQGVLHRDPEAGAQDLISWQVE